METAARGADPVARHPDADFSLNTVNLGLNYLLKRSRDQLQAGPRGQQSPGRRGERRRGVFPGAVAVLTA
jgi:hypothetical protein